MPMKACQSKDSESLHASSCLSASTRIIFPPYPLRKANKALKNYPNKKPEEQSSTSSIRPPQILSHLTTVAYMHCRMEVKRLVMLDHYPREYRRALRNTLGQNQLAEYLKGSMPLFFFGPLMLPSFLKAMTDADIFMDQAKHMTQASLLCHKLYLFEENNLPLVMPSTQPEDYVDGMLVFNLTAQRRGWIHELEASNEVELRNVQVEIVLEDGNLRTLDAGTFVWKGAIDSGIVPAPTTQWRIDEFLSGPWYERTTSGYLSC